MQTCSAETHARGVLCNVNTLVFVVCFRRANMTLFARAIPYDV